MTTEQQEAIKLAVREAKAEKKRKQNPNADQQRAFHQMTPEQQEAVKLEHLKKGAEKAGVSLQDYIFQKIAFSNRFNGGVSMASRFKK
jgi:hypothetical protein